MSKIKSAKNKIVTGVVESKSADFFRRNRKLSISLGLVLIVVASAIIPIAIYRSFAAAPQLYLSPASTTVQTGSNFTVTLRLDPGTSADAVTATITYDQTKVQFVSIDSSASAFPIQLSSTGGNGTVSIDRGILGSTISADSEVAKITFTAISSTAGAVNLQLAGNATLNGAFTNPAAVSATVNITVPNQVQNTASYTIEPSTATPVVGTQFGLKVYVTSNTNIQGGEVIVNLPATMPYQGTLDTTGSAFNPATTVTGTTATSVHIVFVTQATSLTGKQLVATIPVIASTTGVQNITFSGARVADTNSVDITPVTANATSVTVGAAIAKPIVGMPGKAQLAASENITNLVQPFSITNFDATGTYTVTMGGQTLTQSGGSFAIPASLHNGDYTLQVAVTKNGTGDSSSYTIRLRSPNVNRTGCVELLDLLAVNKAYGTASTTLDLNFDGTVSLIDLLTVTGNWGGACV